MSTLVNTEALASSIYNPQIDPKVLMLQDMMQKSSPSSKLSPTGFNMIQMNTLSPESTAMPRELHEHMTMFNNLSVFNQYNGVIVNPAACIVDEIRDVIRDNIGYVPGQAGYAPGTCLALINDAKASYPGWGEVEVAILDALGGKAPVTLEEYLRESNNQTLPIWPGDIKLSNGSNGYNYFGYDGSQLPGYGRVDYGDDESADYLYIDHILETQGINGALDCVEDHTDRLSFNMPSLSGIAQAAMALDTIMNLLSNPCLGLSGFMGSIMEKGKALLAEAKAHVEALANKARAWIDQNVAPIVNEIKDAIASATAVVGEMMKKAREEITKFAKALIAQARQGLAELMANLPNDPCLKSLAGGLLSGGAAALLGG